VDGKNEENGLFLLFRTSMGASLAPEQFFKSLSLAVFLKELTFKTHGYQPFFTC